MKRKLSAALCTALVLAGLTAGCGDPETKPVQLEGAVYMKTGNEEKISGSRRVIYFQETSEILHNPGMGWVLLEEPLYPGRATLGWQGDFPEADSVSLSLSWGNVEVADGKYDWSEMDKAIDYWTSLGKKINMRLTTDLNTIGYPLAGVPDWIGDDYGVPYTVEPGVGAIGTRLYDLANPTFLKFHDRFVRVFAERYRDNPMVDVIEIRSYGWWGEWHSSGNFRSLEERVTTLRHMLDIWQKAWGDKLMVVSASYEYNRQYEPYEVLDTSMTSMDDFAYASAFDYTVQKGMTFRRDGIGAALHYWDEKLLEDAAHSLQAFHGAVYQGQVFSVPAQIFAGDEGVPDGDVFAVPESVLGKEPGVFDLHVFHAIKGIVAVKGQTGNSPVLAVHGEVVAFGGDVFRRHVGTAPKGLDSGWLRCFWRIRGGAFT